MKKLYNVTKKSLFCGLISLFIVSSMVLGASAKTASKTASLSISGDYTWVVAYLQVDYNTSTKKISDYKIVESYRFIGVSKVTSKTSKSGNSVTGTVTATLSGNTKKHSETITIS